VVVHRTPQKRQNSKTKAVYPSDLMQKFKVCHPVKVSQEVNKKSNPSFTIVRF